MSSQGHVPAGGNPEQGDRHVEETVGAGDRCDSKDVH